MPDRIVARQIMTVKLTTLRPETDVYEAIESLLKNRISGAPVVSPGGKLLGILSEIDCINRLVQAAHDSTPSGTVEAFMSRDPRTIGPETDLLSIAHAFLNNHFRRLPVVDEDGVLLGQISRRDLLRALNELVRAEPGRDAKLLYLSALVRHDEHPIRK